LDQDNLPLITVVIPVYNHEAYVIESIRSVIGQSYPKIELIVINDGSKDRSHEMVLTLVAECKQRFVRFEYINRENRGLSATLNQALAMAQGRYLGLLASDDMILPDKFCCLVEALEATDDGCAGAFGNASFIDEHGRATYLDAKGNVQDQQSDETCSDFLDLYTRERTFDYKTHFGSYLTLLGGNYLPAMSSLLKTAIVRDVGGWTAGNVLEDWEMWLKLSKHHNFLFIDKTMALYRVHGKNTVITMKPQLERAALMLLASEREYCTGNGLDRAWEDSFYGILYWIVRFGDAPFKDRLREFHYLELSDVLPFVSSIARARWATFLKDWSRHSREVAEKRNLPRKKDQRG
jgi:alpha-1,3-rhamnosyltransferase